MKVMRSVLRSRKKIFTVSVTSILCAVLKEPMIKATVEENPEDPNELIKVSRRNDSMR